MNPVSFVKSHGLGNDFIILDRREWGRDLLPEDARALCDRKIGLGADGLLILKEAADGRPFMRILNADGSEPEMCGNGLRVFARYLVDTHDHDRERLDIETLSGVRTATVGVTKADGTCSVRVTMGEPVFQNETCEVVTTADGQSFEGTFVSMGNPHFVVPMEQEHLTRDFAARYGPMLEQHDRFLDGANIEFVAYDDVLGCSAIVWERGCGITDACGTGACAIVAAGIIRGLLQPELDHQVHLPGGALEIRWSARSEEIWMTGPTQVVAQGLIPARR